LFIKGSDFDLIHMRLLIGYWNLATAWIFIRASFFPFRPTRPQLWYI
jgi:hypothetical protein